MTPEETKKMYYEAGADEARLALLNELIIGIGAIKVKVAEACGTNKYDSCYDDCINLLKSKLNK